MSRTKKGSKPVGYDYWSRRPTPDMSPGRDAKKMTHRRERIQSKEEVESQLSQIAQEIKERIQAYADLHKISFEEAQKRANIKINGKSYKIGEEDET